MTFPTAVLGTMYYGSLITSATAHRMIDMYLDSGLDMLDTASNYAFWVEDGTGDESEFTIGKWLRANPGKHPRIATKVGARPKFPGADIHDAEGLAPETIRRALEGSLRRLGKSEVTLLYAHIDDQNVPLAESLGTLSALVDEGLIENYAISNFTAPRLQEAFDVVAGNGLHPFVGLQQRYSVILPPPEADVWPHVIASIDVQDLLAEHQTPLVAYSPLIEGALSNATRPFPPAYDTEGNRVAREDLVAEAEKANVTLSQLVLRKIVDQGVVPLLGARTEEQLAESLAAVR